MPVLLLSFRCRLEHAIRTGERALCARASPHMNARRCSDIRKLRSRFNRRPYVVIELDLCDHVSISFDTDAACLINQLFSDSR